MDSLRTTGAAAFRREIAEADAHSTTRFTIPGLSPEQSWALFAETELVTRALNAPTLQVERVPVAPGVTRRIMTTVEPTSLVYEEEHYQWEEGAWHGLRRFFLNGPLARLVVLFAHHADPEGASVELAIGAWPRGPDGVPVAQFVATEALPNALRTLAERQTDLASMPHPAFRVPPIWSDRIDQARVRGAERTLLACGEDPLAVQHLLSWLVDRPDYEVTHMAPLALAGRWSLEPETVVDAFLRAARIGLLHPQWSVACPSCRGLKGTTLDVAALTRQVHCDDCNLSFDADPATNLECTFTPTPAVRPVVDEWTCISGPTRTPHIKAQGFVGPGEALVLVANPSQREGRAWRLRCPELSARTDLQHPSGVWQLDENSIETLAPATDLEVRNTSSRRVRVILEDPTLSPAALRARDILDRPRFRELFAADQWEFLSAMERAWREAFGAEGTSPPQGPDQPYDLLVIGGGPAGESAALRAAQHGRSVALVEARRDFGGSSGLASKAFREAATRVLAWSQSASRGEGDVVRMLFEARFAPYRRYVAALQSHDVLQRLGRAGVHVYYGRASFGADRRILVDRSQDQPPLDLEAGHVLVATGARPARPEHIPFDQHFVLDAVDVRDLDRLPSRLCVVGSGIVALEYATVMAALGVRVSIVCGGSALAPQLDRELALAMRQHMEAAGIRVLRDAAVNDVTVAPDSADPVVVHLTPDSAVACDLLLYAVGQEANTETLTCSAAGVELARYGRVKVDGALRTSSAWVSAAGDVLGPPGLASTASHQGKLVSERLFGQRDESSLPATFPIGLWTVPEIGAVGLTEEQASEQGLDYIRGYAHFRDLPRGILNGELEGWIKLLVERRSLRLLGVHILGEAACELIHYGTALVQRGASAAEIAGSVFAAATYHGIYGVAAEDALAASAPPRPAAG